MTNRFLAALTLSSIAACEPVPTLESDSGDREFVHVAIRVSETPENGWVTTSVKCTGENGYFGVYEYADPAIADLYASNMNPDGVRVAPGAIVRYQLSRKNRDTDYCHFLYKPKQILSDGTLDAARSEVNMAWPPLGDFSVEIAPKRHPAVLDDWIATVTEDNGDTWTF